MTYEEFMDECTRRANSEKWNSNKILERSELHTCRVIRSWLGALAPKVFADMFGSEDDPYYHGKMVKFFQYLKINMKDGD